MLPKTNSVSHDWVDQDHEGTSVEKALEIVIPFTTLSHAQKSIHRAEWLCSGLNATIRVVRVLHVPYPLDLDRPRVSDAAASDELRKLDTDLPVKAEIWMSRDWIAGFLLALPKPSLVILTYQRRILRTREEKLARALKRAGHRVSMFLEDKRRV